MQVKVRFVGWCFKFSTEKMDEFESRPVSSLHRIFLVNLESKRDLHICCKQYGESYILQCSGLLTGKDRRSINEFCSECIAADDLIQTTSLEEELNW